MVSKEIGAPVSGIVVALDANALTPRDLDLFPVLGPEIHHPGLAIVRSRRLCVQVAAVAASLAPSFTS